MQCQKRKKRVNSRIDSAETQYGDLECGFIKIIQNKVKIKLKYKLNAQDMWDYIKEYNICVIGAVESGDKENRPDQIEVKMEENFQKWLNMSSSNSKTFSKL